MPDFDPLSAFDTPAFHLSNFLTVSLSPEKGAKPIEPDHWSAINYRIAQKF
jgi:hypothetical protein